ncbi:NADP-dependent oxidoreductase domain-containing protein [Lophiotrema nucula]|uniref:NADP-dependent oxidoreductase domain-containing protein n=1 Tax=Lophiotrema nucula TaxID=690887 RepID=A0A6A5ZMM7_9PLEO|nr:NADP-dependent oxidoreductase domain-containing protein [Lophiotrema nucula]
MVKLVGKEVGPVGYGLMGLTWRRNPINQEGAFEAMRSALSNGAVFWNGGEIYGTAERNSLHLLNEYFTKYPEDADKVLLSIKGGCAPGELRPDGSKENIQRSIDECLKHLSPVKKSLDLFECARVDTNVPIEDTISYIDEYVKAGKLGGISLSEVSAKTIRKAAAVAKISAVEVELSLWSTQIFENGIAEACAELGIPIVAYSPLGRGFLTGEYRKWEDIPKDSNLHMFPRYSKENFDQNLVLLHQVEEIAKKKGVTAPQIALGWVLAHNGKPGMPEIIPIPGATRASRIEENTQPAQLSDAEFDELNGILSKFEAAGGRYAPQMSHHLEL